MPLMTTYKVGQGRMMRNGVLLLLVLITAWGCYAFWEYGESKLDRLLGLEPTFGKPLFGDGGSSLFGGFNLAFVVAAVLFIATLIFFRIKLNKENVAEHLIGTELELRRVKWPTKEQVLESGSNVIYYTAMLALVIAILDFDMATIVSHYVLGQDLDTSGWGRLLTMIPGVETRVWLHEGLTIAIIAIQAYILIALSRQTADKKKEA